MAASYSSSTRTAPPSPPGPLPPLGASDMASHPAGASRIRRKARKHKQLWPKTVLRKWLNIRSPESDFSADEGDTTDDADRELEYEGA